MQKETEHDFTTLPDLQQTVKRLSQVSVLAAAYHLIEVWLVVGAMVYVSVAVVPFSSGLFGVLAYVLAVAIIASRQHALMVLTHEGIHKRLSRTLWLNDWIARFVASFPVFISLAKWRFIHLYHHQYTHTADDPDRAIYARYPLTNKKFWWLLLRDFCGLNVVSTLKYFIDLPFVTPEFNRRFLGHKRAAQYQQIADMRLFALFWSVILVG